MIRRDYILRHIEQFAAILSRITGLTKRAEWQEATAEAAGGFQQLVGLDAEAVTRATDTELLARLMDGEPTLAVENKIFTLAALLKAHGDVVAGQNCPDESRVFYLKGLDLLLDTLGRAEVIERMDFVPTVEAFLTGLRDIPLPPKTNVMLMRHYEGTGELAKAEDALFALLDAEPQNPELLDFGVTFYQRILNRSDEALIAGNLPRTESEEGLAQLQALRRERT